MIKVIIKLYNKVKRILLQNYLKFFKYYIKKKKKRFTGKKYEICIF